ncbi:hotdog fold thioesterase, partial [Pseudomonas aeruginosa]|nr:hotdog fold thioesterase [Pseudomonas aeruginosa]
LGIIYTRLEEGLLEAEMPVDARTHQPFGLLHGGASAALAETLGNTPSTVGRIYNTVYQRCKAQRDLIIDKFPKLNRFLTGYDLRHVFNDEMSEFDLT